MRILIVEDEPLIAMDLEDIVAEATSADCVWARNVADGLKRVMEGVDFALLDFDLGGKTSIPVALRLREFRVPFCFVSGSLSELPAQFSAVPRVSKPYSRIEIERVLARA